MSDNIPIPHSEPAMPPAADPQPVGAAAVPAPVPTPESAGPRRDRRMGDRHPTARRKMRKLDVMVADVIRETHDTVTLVLFTGNEGLDYRPGHFLTVDPHQFAALDRFTAYLEHVKGRREPPRAYSMASAPHERHLAFTVKAEHYIPGVTDYPPLLSPLLVEQTPPGTRLTVTGFTGPFVLPHDIAERTDRVVHLAAGSGVVPNFSMIKHLIHHHPQIQQTLIYANKTWADVIYKAPLAALEAAHPQSLRVIHALTREEDPLCYGGEVVRGRIDHDLLKRFIESPTHTEFFLCGPALTPIDRKHAAAEGREPAPRFMETALELVAELGVAKDRIHKESYG